MIAQSLSYFRPLSLGSLQLPSNIWYSPLAGCSDYPYRKMAARFGPGLVFCEMVKMDALVRHDLNTYRLLDFDGSMHPIGAQLCGSKKAYAGRAAKIIEELGFDVVDLNCGCPVDKVTGDGSGSGLLKVPELIGEILAEMVAAVTIPVTVKIRAGWCESSILVEEITQMAEAAGAKAISVHGRTRKQAYKGPANWDYIKRAVDAAGNIVVMGNGDVFSPEAAVSMMEQTGCDGVLVSRGTLGAPWIAEDIERRFKSEEPAGADQRCIKKTLQVHFEEMQLYYDVAKVIVEMRKVGCWYLGKDAGAREFRRAMARAQSLVEVEKLIDAL